MGEAVAQEEWQDLYIHARDGIRLYGRHYPAPGSNKRPVLCLAGLTRNSRDFHTIASALSGSGPDARDLQLLLGLLPVPYQESPHHHRLAELHSICEWTE